MKGEPTTEEVRKAIEFLKSSKAVKGEKGGFMFFGSKKDFKKLQDTVLNSNKDKIEK